MVGQTATMRMEDIVSDAQGRQKILPGVHPHPRNRRESIEPGIELGRLVDQHSLVGAPGRADLDGEGSVSGYRSVVLEAVDRVIRGAYHLHTHALHDATRAESRLGEQPVAVLPD